MTKYVLIDTDSRRQSIGTIFKSALQERLKNQLQPAIDAAAQACAEEMLSQKGAEWYCDDPLEKIISEAFDAIYSGELSASEVQITLIVQSQERLSKKTSEWIDRAKNVQEALQAVQMTGSPAYIKMIVDFIDTVAIEDAEILRGKV